MEARRLDVALPCAACGTEIMTRWPPTNGMSAPRRYVARCPACHEPAYAIERGDDGVYHVRPDASRPMPGAWRPTPPSRARLLSDGSTAFGGRRWVPPPTTIHLEDPPQTPGYPSHVRRTPQRQRPSSASPCRSRGGRMLSDPGVMGRTSGASWVQHSSSGSGSHGYRSSSVPRGGGHYHGYGVGSGSARGGGGYVPGGRAVHFSSSTKGGEHNGAAVCKSCGNTGIDLQGKPCSCGAGLSAHHPGQAVCKSCNNTGIDIFGKPCSCGAGENTHPNGQAICKSCNNTGIDISGHPCTCKVGRAGSKSPGQVHRPCWGADVKPYGRCRTCGADLKEPHYCNVCQRISTQPGVTDPDDGEIVDSAGDFGLKSPNGGYSARHRGNSFVMPPAGMRIMDRNDWGYGLAHARRQKCLRGMGGVADAMDSWGAWRAWQGGSYGQPGTATAQPEDATHQSPRAGNQTEPVTRCQCPECGNHCLEDSRFCSRCGRRRDMWWA